MTPEEFTHYIGIVITQEDLFDILDSNNYDSSTLSKEEWCKQWMKTQLCHFINSLYNRLNQAQERANQYQRSYNDLLNEYQNLRKCLHNHLN